MTKKKTDKDSRKITFYEITEKEITEQELLEREMQTLKELNKKGKEFQEASDKFIYLINSSKISHREYYLASVIVILMLKTKLPSYMKNKILEQIKEVTSGNAFGLMRQMEKFMDAMFKKSSGKQSYVG